MSSSFALLADGRFPVGGHVHSAGVEAAVVDGRISCVDELAAFLLGRLHSTGRVEAALAAAASVQDDWDALDAEADARITAPPLKSASRKLGRQLLRAARPCWPSPALAALAGTHPHQPVALGAVCASADLGPLDAARLALHHATTTGAQAGVRLLGLDPFAVAVVTARLADAAEVVAAEAAASAGGPLRDLPATTGPILDVAACEHAGRDAALFAT